MPSPSAEFIDAALDNTAEPPEDAGRAETGSGPIVEESGELHGSNVPSSETLIDDESVSSDSLRFVTPGSIRDKLIALGGQPIQNIGELGKQVQQCSLFSPPGRDGGSSTFSLFLAGHTGVDRPYQDYVCRQDKCPAFVKYQLRDGLALFIDGQFTHDHDVDTTTCRHPPAFSRDERRLVQDLTALGLSSGQIMLRTGLMPGPQPMYNARRGILEEMRSGQPDKLRDAMKKWPELETQLFHDKEKKFVGAYCFHKVFADSHVCRGTLIMDDTACTNMFGLPLILIVGNDEYNFTQIIAFAFTLNRTAISFEHFLGWVKEQLPVAPKAFVVDRHLGQLAALKTVFPESRIVFCRFHLAANIAATFHSDESQVLQAFYDLVKGRITEEVFIDRLKGEQTRYQETSAQWKLIDFLLGNLDHYSPIRISEYTRHQVSSRVEGVFAVLKRMLRGELCTLAGILVALHMYATSWFRRRLRPRLPSLPPWVMSRENQSCLGIYALSRIARQFPLVKSGFICDICEEAILNHQCCHKALMSKLPCVHFLAYRAGTRFEHGLPGDTVEDVGLPCLALGDIPAEYRQIELTGNVPVAHTTTELESAPGGHAHLSWEFGHLSARFEPVFEAARRDTAVQAMIERLLDEFDRHRATGATPGSEIQDPWRPRSRGRPPSRPSLRSLPGRLHRCKRARRS
jgi:hypothetical protein